ncbi:hypothetical protein BPTFM16_01070 [Altererythrobacter insulae]|nr:hypothetical protein BPTFM16_01070 [Altererythrobacter insulae]
MLASVFGFTASALVASGAVTYSDIEMFEPVELADNLSVVAFGVAEDTRCKNSDLCFENDRLAIAVLVTENGERRGVEMELGEKLQLSNGTLQFTASSTPPTGRWATDFKKYRVSFSFEQNR